MRKLRKKGYYFIIDAFIGSTIIFLSLLIIFNGGVKPTKIQYNYALAEDYSTFILNTKLQDISNPYVRFLESNRIINDTSLTIMEEADLLYFNNNTASATGLIRNLTEPLVPSKYGFSYNIIDGPLTTVIYNRTSVDINQANMVIASRKITFLQINESAMFGPAITEIKVWI